jgi:hypothetical protein
MTMMDVLAGVDPAKRGELVKQWMGLGGLQDKDALLKEQMAQAQALLNAPGRHYNTWGGALAGGLGDIVSGIGNKRELDRLTADQKTNADLIQAGRDTFGQTYAGIGAPPGIPQMLQRPGPNDAPYQLNPFMMGGG